MKYPPSFLLHIKHAQKSHIFVTLPIFIYQSSPNGIKQSIMNQLICSESCWLLKCQSARWPIQVTSLNITCALISLWWSYSFRSIGKWLYFPEASDTGFCRGSKECLQTNMTEDFMPQKCEASKCESAVDIFYIVYVRHSVVPVHSPCRVITHSVKGLSDMRHCSKGCQCFSTCTNVQCKYKPQSDVKY